MVLLSYYLYQCTQRCWLHLLPLFPKQDTYFNAQTWSNNRRIRSRFSRLFHLLFHYNKILPWVGMDKTKSNTNIIRSFQQRSISDWDGSPLWEQLETGELWINRVYSKPSLNSPLHHHTIHCIHCSFRRILLSWSKESIEDETTWYHWNHRQNRLCPRYRILLDDLCKVSGVLRYRWGKQLDQRDDLINVKRCTKRAIFQTQEWFDNDQYLT